MSAGSAPRAPEEPPTPRASQPRPPKDTSTKTRPERPVSSETDPVRLLASWLIEPNTYERIHNWLADAMPFHWRERARRPGYWRRRAVPVALLVAGVIIAVIVGNLGISVARQVSSVFASAAAVNTTQQESTPGSVIISPLNNSDGSPTPGPMTYTVGVWTSNTMPAGGSVTVFVRVSDNTEPVAQARVYIQTQVGGGSGPRLGPLTTNAYGMASAQLRYGAGQGTPVFLTATTTINGKTYSGTYTFVAY